MVKKRLFLRILGLVAALRERRAGEPKMLVVLDKSLPFRRRLAKCRQAQANDILVLDRKSRVAAAFPAAIGRQVCACGRLRPRAIGDGRQRFGLIAQIQAQAKLETVAAGGVDGDEQPRPLVSQDTATPRKMDYANGFFALFTMASANAEKTFGVQRR